MSERSERTMSVVAVSSITRRFGDFTAVDSVDLEIAPGEVVGLLGANGAGKTTLIRMLLGLLTPTSGRVRLFGSAPDRQQRRRIGYVPQGLGLYTDLTVEENLAFRAAAFGLDRSSVSHPRDVAGIVGRLPLGRQRVAAFHAALQHAPALLVLDEPTSGVSPLVRSDLWDLIRRQAERGAAVLASTHYMDEAVQADRVVVLARGRVVAAGTVDDVVGARRSVAVDTADWAAAFDAIDRSGRTAVLAGRSVRVPGGDAEAIGALLRDAGVSADVATTRATLDEAMVELSR